MYKAPPVTLEFRVYEHRCLCGTHGEETPGGARAGELTLAASLGGAIFREMCFKSHLLLCAKAHH